ncbi:MAG TPA: hypothetical protein ENG87_04050 [Candidatus Pacearchaeota archaeon]|nr:hypothetical protein BMS3Abin17_00126 [archaeon BMS3Abin17]HDK42527.1 hypothetical protein [Candidatus Pacearchaeota archaeon]
MKKTKINLKNEIPQNESINSSKNICFSSEDILNELQGKNQLAGFSKEVPFRNSPPYFDFPFTQFSDFMNK